ncbi:hypothetical protein CRUP_013627 [Coryphaenoides rupestris]|nr:hypothetical protein CRUP_013627 [Coryphaenoides rupestris]
MTVAARLEDLEVTLEHMLMDVFDAPRGGPDGRTMVVPGAVTPGRTRRLMLKLPVGTLRRNSGERYITITIIIIIIIIIITIIIGN